jgi:hypothetical protein
VIDYHDAQTDEEGAAEIEAAYGQEGITWMAIPTGLVDKVQAQIALEQEA